MRKKLLGLAFAGAFLAAGGASAAVLSFTGTLSFGLSTLPALVIPGGGTATVNGSGGGFHLNTFTVQPNAMGPGSASLPVTSSATVNSVRFTNLANTFGSFGNPNTPLSGGAPGGGQMGLSGMAKICLALAACPFANVPVPLTPTSNGLIGFGVGGTQNVKGAINITLQHNAWTIGTPVMTIHDSDSVTTTPTLADGFAHGPQSLTSSTAQESGVVQLVSATKAYTSLTGAFPELPLIATINLHWIGGSVPEPGTTLLLGAGVAGLIAVGRKRRK